MQFSHMRRNRVLISIGDNLTSMRLMMNHELWMKVLHRYQVSNVLTPLFFYRQHSSSINRDQGRLLKARREINRDLIEQQQRSASAKPRLVAMVPAKNN